MGYSLQTFFNTYYTCLKKDRGGGAAYAFFLVFALFFEVIFPIGAKCGNPLQVSSLSYITLQGMALVRIRPVRVNFFNVSDVSIYYIFFRIFFFHNKRPIIRSLINNL